MTHGRTAQCTRILSTGGLAAQAAAQPQSMEGSRGSTLPINSTILSGHGQMWKATAVAPQAVSRLLPSALIQLPKE
jgi:hypothetical protein